MSCAIDHSIPLTIPSFLCRGCHPELKEAWPASGRVSVLGTPGNSPASRNLTEKDKAAIAQIEAEERSSVTRQQMLVDGELTEVIVHRRPGIIAVLMEMMRRSGGASKVEMLAELVRRFPQREAKGMASTIAIQSRKLSTRTFEDPKRGRVYYMIVDK